MRTCVNYNSEHFIACQSHNTSAFRVHGQGNATWYWHRVAVNESRSWAVPVHISQEIRRASWPLDKWVLDGWIVAPQLVMPRSQCRSTCVGTLWGSPLLISSWDKAFYTSGWAEGYNHACKTFGSPLILLVRVKGLCISSQRGSSGVRWRFLTVVMETPFHWGSDGIHLVLESLRGV